MPGIRVQLELDDGSFSTGMIHAGESIDQFRRNVGQGISSIEALSAEGQGLMKTFRDVTLTLGLAREAFHFAEQATTGWVREIVNVNAEFERMVTVMKSLSTVQNPMKEATDAVTHLREEAKNAPFSLTAMHDAFVRLKSSGIEDVTGTMKSLTDAVAAFGGTDDNLHRAALAMQEMAGKGVVQMKELRNQLGMAVPNAIPLLARSVGVSYEQLMSDVHTGTVDAKEVIKSLQLEFERTFGGAAQRQMETFNGQMARFSVIMQGLAIEQVGGGLENKNGFFNVIKQQLTDLNTMMEGPAIKNMATSLGQGLVSVTMTIRGAIEDVVKFKDEIFSAGEMLLYAFGARAAFTVLGSGVKAIQTMRSEVTLLGLSFQTMRGEMFMNNIQAMIGTMTGGARGMSTFGAAIRNVGLTLGFVGTAVGTVMPYLPLLAVAIGAVTEYFGLFRDRAKEAEVNLERFGARSRQEAAGADTYLAKMEAQLAKLEAAKARSSSSVVGGRGRTGTADTSRIDAEIKQAQDEVNRVSEVRRNAMKQGAEEEDNAFTTKAMKQASDEIAIFQAAYAKESIERAKAFSAQQQELARHHKSVADLDNAYQIAQKDQALKLYDQMIVKYEQVIETAKKMQQANNPAEAGKGAMLEAKAMEELNTQIKARQDTVNQRAGLQLNAKPQSDEKVMESARKALEAIQAQTDGFMAALDGLDPKVAELQARIALGLKFKDADVDTEALKGMTAEIIRAKSEADRLHDAMTGQSKLQHDLNKAIQDDEEAIFKDKYGKLSQIDQITTKVKLGMYGEAEGPGRSAFEKFFQGVHDQALVTEGAAENLQKKLVETFAGDPKTALETYNATLGKTAEALGKVTDASNRTGLPMPGAPGVRGGGPMDAADRSGTYMSRVIGRESSGDPNAHAATSSAAGLGQFIDGTWRAFMSDMHPEVAKDQVIALKANTQMQKEAILWYAQQNAQSLRNSGFDPSDANVYLAHFLGPDGAKKVLGADPSRTIQSIPGMEKSVAANKGLGDTTVGELLAEMQRKFGNGHTVPGADEDMRDNLPRRSPRLDKPVMDPQNSVLWDKGHLTSQQRAADDASAALRNNLETMKGGLQQAQVQVDETRKHYAELVRSLTVAGGLGEKTGIHDINDPRLADALKTANEWDAADKLKNDNAKARTKAQSDEDALDKKYRDLQTEQRLRLANMSNPKGLSSDMLKLQQTGADNLADAKAAGYGTDQIKEMQDKQALVLQSQRDSDIEKDFEALTKKTEAYKDSLLDQDQARDAQEAREVARLQKELEDFRGTQEEKAALVKKMSDFQTAATAANAAKSPLGKEMKDWGDMSGAIGKDAASWTNSLTDGLANSLMGQRTNWRSIQQGMMKDLLTQGLHFGISGIFNGAKGGLTGGGASKAGGAAGGIAGIGKLFGLFHTGGLIGGTAPMSRMVDPSVFAGAPRFHTGGIVDGEVPIIAKKGEGVFTPEQMAAMGSTGGGDSHHYAISMPITVHAAGGTNAQNQDLAKQTAAHAEAAVRKLVVDELMKQNRPGNMLNHSG